MQLLKGTLSRDNKTRIIYKDYADEVRRMLIGETDEANEGKAHRNN